MHDLVASSDPPGRPEPPEPGGNGGGHGGAEQELDVKVRPKSAVPRLYKVILHNDDYTTMEFVVDVLKAYFHKSDTEAVFIMLKVHRTGAGVAGVYTRDVAETKVAEVTSHARDNGMPLMVTAEPESGPR